MKETPQKNTLFDVDISEDKLLKAYPDAFNLLLKDHTMSTPDCQHNIFWATSDYEELGKEYEYSSQILPELIIGEWGKVIMPRVLKTSETQQERIKNKAEVFTPSWVCNAQNNLMDNAWFGCEDVFNHENDDHTWTTNIDKITFPKGKTWRDYVRRNCLEITCGEAPYLASRYDATTGKPIPLAERIGIIDRKLRVVGEHTTDSNLWLKWAHIAYQSTYGFEWQGDSLLLARENLFMTFIEYYHKKFDKYPKVNSLNKVANIISWNLWQMDGLKGTIPDSDKECFIMNWTVNPKKPVKFIDLIKIQNI